jgi:hypothetical protein
MAKNKKDDILNESNFQVFARKAVEKYMEKGMMLDGMLWGQIIKYYNKALSQALTAKEAREMIEKFKKDIEGHDFTGEPYYPREKDIEFGNIKKLGVIEFLIETFKDKDEEREKK